MSRVTNEEVLAILTDDVPSDADLTPFINTANIMVDSRLLDAGLTDNILTQIELYLSAHYSLLKYRSPMVTKANMAEDDYSNPLGTMLNQTVYGQQAIAFDTSGILKNSTNTKYKAVAYYNTVDRGWKNGRC